MAQRAGNSVEVLLTRYAKCLYDRQSINNRIGHLLRAYDMPFVSFRSFLGLAVALDHPSFSRCAQSPSQ